MRTVHAHPFTAAGLAAQRRQLALVNCSLVDSATAGLAHATLLQAITSTSARKDCQRLVVLVVRQLLRVGGFSSSRDTLYIPACTAVQSYGGDGGGRVCFSLSSCRGLPIKTARKLSDHRERQREGKDTSSRLQLI